MRYLITLILFGTFASSAFAQFPPRTDDHFWRRKVLFRIDLEEKLNRSLIDAEQKHLYLPTDGSYLNKDGIIEAILKGFKRKEFLGYNPDSLEAEMSFDDVYNILKKKNLDIVDGVDDEEDLGVEGATDDDYTDDDFGMDDEDDMDDFGDEEEGDELSGSGGGGGGDELSDEIFSGTGRVLEVIEDRIFDKNKSDMYYDIQYLRIVYIDPTGKLEEDVVVAFKYEDVMPVLNNTQWKNKYNDAEYRTMQEIIEMRLFHGYFLDISGTEMYDLEDAERRREQMLEYEHHLWEY